jgi:hypothetical protein
MASKVTAPQSVDPRKKPIATKHVLSEPQWGYLASTVNRGLRELGIKPYKATPHSRGLLSFEQIEALIRHIG